MNRRIAVLVDGGFFLKRLPGLVAPRYRDSAERVTTQLRLACKSHVKQLTGHEGGRGWLDHIYRIFFYDARPYDGKAHHPTRNQPIDFAQSDLARDRAALFDCLRRQRKVALRLGKVVRHDDWAPPARLVRKVLGSRDWFAGLELTIREADGGVRLSAGQVDEALRLQRHWQAIRDDDIRLDLRQKGVDLRIGVDIASLTLKRQVDTIILISGDSDFVPAAKLARREGVEFILDPMWQSVNADLFEHIDGLQSGFRRPRPRANDEDTA